MASDFTWWKNALNGKPGPIHDGKPQAGFYRMRQRKDGPFLPVAIWLEDGAMLAQVDGQPADATKIWLWACKNPVAYEDWKRADAGEGWADEVRSAPANHNGPPEELSIEEQINTVVATAEAFLKEHPDRASWTQAQIDLCQNYRNRITKLGQDAEKARETEKRPHLDAGKKVDEKWKPVTTKADEQAKALRTALTAAMKAADDRAREAARKAAQEAAEAAAAAAAQSAATDAPETPAPASEAPVVNLEEVRVKAGSNGRRAGLKTVKVLTVTDLAEATTALLKDDEAFRTDLAALVSKHANRRMREDKQTAGTRVDEDRVAS